MTTTPTVEYDKFISLNGLDLCHYMEPLVSAAMTKVSKDTLQRLRSELPTYDEYHLTYALTLGAKYSPETFAMQLPLYLAHEHGSVWSAALRSVDQLPEKYVTHALVDSVRSVHLSYPSKPWITDALEKLEERLRERAGRGNRGRNGGRAPTKND